jgi:hypothetical protein
MATSARSSIEIVINTREILQLTIDFLGFSDCVALRIASAAICGHTRHVALFEKVSLQAMPMVDERLLTCFATSFPTAKAIPINSTQSFARQLFAAKSVLPLLARVCLVAPSYETSDFAAVDAPVTDGQQHLSLSWLAELHVVALQDMHLRWLSGCRALRCSLLLLGDNPDLINLAHLEELQFRAPKLDCFCRIYKALHSLRRLDIRGFAACHQHCFGTLRRLTTLRITSSSSFTDSFLADLARAQLHQPQIHTLNLTNCAAFQGLSISALPHLQHLRLSNCSGLDDSAFSSPLPRVRTLDLERMTNLTDVVFASCPQLRGLRLQLCAKLTLDGTPLLFLETLFVRACRAFNRAQTLMLPALTSIHLDTSGLDWRHLPADVFGRLPLRTLRRISLGDCKHIGEESFKYLTAAVSLRVRDCPGFTDECLNELPQLQHLYIESCANFRGVSLRTAALSSLELRNCVRFADGNLACTGRDLRTLTLYPMPYTVDSLLSWLPGTVVTLRLRGSFPFTEIHANRIRSTSVRVLEIDLSNIVVPFHEADTDTFVVSAFRQLDSLYDTNDTSASSILSARLRKAGVLYRWEAHEDCWDFSHCHGTGDCRIPAEFDDG